MPMQKRRILEIAGHCDDEPQKNRMSRASSSVYENPIQNKTTPVPHPLCCGGLLRCHRAREPVSSHSGVNAHRHLGFWTAIKVARGRQHQVNERYLVRANLRHDWLYNLLANSAQNSCIAQAHLLRAYARISARVREGTPEVPLVHTRIRCFSYSSVAGVSFTSIFLIAAVFKFRSQAIF